MLNRALKKWIFSFFIIVVIAIITTYLFTNRIVVTKASFSDLPGWKTANVVPSFTAFKKSCRHTLTLPPGAPVGSKVFPYTAKDWYASCKAASNLKKITNQNAKTFFQRWFKVASVTNSNHHPGLFTAYYLIEIHGALKASRKYPVPIYAKPDRLVYVDLQAFNKKLPKKIIPSLIKKNNVVIPFPFTRKQINNGAIDNISKRIAWTDNRVSRYFLQVEGSGYLRLPSGKRVLLNYGGANGKKGELIGKTLVHDHLISLKKSSSNEIRDWLNQHPEQARQLLNENDSFVFFKKAKNNNTFGFYKDVPLTSGYSLAVDIRVIPIGIPVWLDTKLPSKQAFQRLMMAQDSGSAIHGYVRGDVFLGAGRDAEQIASVMKSHGRYWLLLPKPSIQSGSVLDD